MGACLDWAESAGIIESSSGSATLAPMPFSIVRRVSAFLVRNVMTVSLPLLGRAIGGTARHSVLERDAAHHAQHQRGKRVVLPRRFPGDDADRRLVVMLDIARQRVHEEFAGHGLDEESRVAQHQPAYAL